MPIESISTKVCSRNGEVNTKCCVLLFAEVLPTNPFTSNDKYCKGCRQIYNQLSPKGLFNKKVGNVSQDVFEISLANARALEYRAHPSDNFNGIEVIKYVAKYAQRPEVDDGLFKAKIEEILARGGLPTDTTQDDEEQDGEQEDNGEDEEQGANGQDDIQSSGEQEITPINREGVLSAMKAIAERQAQDASAMLILIAKLEKLSTA
ncbi:MAG: hypothetical protein JOS17DRAFT_746416 [Linnemannia elongata]|nr:MAG: hypothetical protein JOS17DRAFT_746416 [Linnemannia elongata]